MLSASPRVFSLGSLLGGERGTRAVWPLSTQHITVSAQEGFEPSRRAMAVDGVGRDGPAVTKVLSVSRQLVLSMNSISTDG